MGEDVIIQLEEFQVYIHPDTYTRTITHTRTHAPQAIFEIR